MRLVTQRLIRAARPLAALDFRRPKASGGGEGVAVVFDLFQAAAATDSHAHQRVFRHVHRHTRLPSQALVHQPQERPAARQDHPPVHDVRGKLGRGSVQSVPDRRDDRVHGYAYGLPDFFASYDDRLRQTRHQIPAPYLGRLLLLQPEGAPELYLELLTGLGADGDLVLLLDIGGDRIVYVVAGDPYGGLGHDDT